MELWKRKHETGQWLEIEAEAMSNQSDFSALNASGIMLSSMVNKQKEANENSENNGKSSIDANAGMNLNIRVTLHAKNFFIYLIDLVFHLCFLYSKSFELKILMSDEKHTINQQPPGNQEYIQGQFPHPMFTPWPIHSPPGPLPMFQGYPMQGMPYYQNYPANSAYFQPPYPSVEDPRQNATQRMGQRRHSMDSRESHAELETWEMDESKARSQDDPELEKESSRKRGSRSGKKQSGMVVIRNINYITSNRQNSSDSESQSASNSESDERAVDMQGSTPKMKRKSTSRSSKINENRIKSVDASNSFDREGTVNRKEEDGGQWQAFQNFLLRDANEEECVTDKGIFAMEKGSRARRRQNAAGDDPLVSNGQDSGEYYQGDMMDMHKISGSIARMPNSSNDELLISRRMGRSGDGRRFADGQIDVQSSEIDGRRGVYRSTTNDDFMIHGREHALAFGNSPSDPLAGNRFERATNNLDSRSSHNLNDDSYIVPLRSLSPDQLGTDGRNAIDIDSEFPSSNQMAENASNKVGNQVSYEPDELILMPERGAEKGSTGYDPALDYEMQSHVNGASANKKNKEAVTDVKQGSKKSDRDRKLKHMDNSDKKKTVGPIRKGKPSKLSPLDEARARAEKLRAFKADMQKIKKQKVLC